jgi:hypothetical protein
MQSKASRVVNKSIDIARSPLLYLRCDLYFFYRCIHNTGTWLLYYTHFTNTTYNSATRMDCVPPFLGCWLQQILLDYGLSQHEFQAKMLVDLDHTSNANDQGLKYQVLGVYK